MLKGYKDFIMENYNGWKEISIRKATIKEVEKFSEEAYAVTAAGLNIFDLICDNPNNTHGAFEGDVMVGAIQFKKSEIEDFTDIDLIFVHPEHRNKEIGKLLLIYVEDNIKIKKLITNPYTSEAGKFFIKHGFIKDEEIDPKDTNTLIKV